MADTNCELGKYFYDDLLKSTSGAFRCIEKGRQYDANYTHGDFPVCDVDDKNDCGFYLRKKSLEEDN